MIRSCPCFNPHFSGSRFQWLTVAALLATTLGAYAQQAEKASAQAQKGKSSSVTDVSLGVFGQLTPSRTRTNINAEYPVPADDYGAVITQWTEGASASAGALGTFHQSFGRWLGYSVNFGYSRFTESYSQGMAFIPNPKDNPPQQPTSNFAQGSIGTNMYELTGAYVVEGPRAKRIDTFTQLGGGILSFLPTQSPSAFAVQFRPTLLFGEGMNYKLSEHWALRVEYRGLFLMSPDFHGEYGGSPVPVSESLTVTNEPTISLVYRLGGKR